MRAAAEQTSFGTATSNSAGICLAQTKHHLCQTLSGVRVQPADCRYEAQCTGLCTPDTWMGAHRVLSCVTHGEQHRSTSSRSTLTSRGAAKVCTCMDWYTRKISQHSTLHTHYSSYNSFNSKGVIVPEIRQ